MIQMKFFLGTTNKTLKMTNENTFKEWNGRSILFWVYKLKYSQIKSYLICFNVYFINNDFIYLVVYN